MDKNPNEAQPYTETRRTLHVVGKLRDTEVQTEHSRPPKKLWLAVVFIALFGFGVI